LSYARAVTPRRRWLAAIAAALIFRIAVVLTWHVPAGDGLQYWQLSQELHHFRFAYHPAPAPLTWTRLPGYPLFLSLGVPFSAPLDRYLIVATLWNALFDILTALLVARMLVEAGRPRAAPWGFGLTVVAPLMLFLSTFGLSESFATFLAAGELLLIARLLRGERMVRNAIVCGAIAGFAELTRADALFVWPSLALALVWAKAPLSEKARALGGFALAAVLVFAPWPLRNQIQFGEPHPLGTRWVKMDGTPQFTEMERWMRTWSSGVPGQSFIHEVIVPNRLAIDPKRPGILLPAMYDDEAERTKVLELFAEYNQTRLTPELDAKFGALADERAHRAPLRTYVGLPLARVLAIWRPVPEWELPVRVGWLGLPSFRPAWQHFEQLIFLLALAGAFLVERRLAAILLLAVLVRTFLPALLHPYPLERYLVEAFPGLLVLAASACETIARRSWPQKS
jgi:hypothetical protein